MFYLVLVAHIILCILLVGLVLIQQGKGADLGAAFGSGGSNTFFGASGATAFVTKLTTGIAVAFMVTSILLMNLYTSHTRNGLGIIPKKDQIQEILDKEIPSQSKDNNALDNQPASDENSIPKPN